MSAFIVEDKTILDVVNTLSIMRNGDWLRDKVKEGGYDLETTEGRKALASDMFALNVYGVEQRYGKGEAEGFRPLDFRYRLTLPVTLIQAYKSLQCWHYQCSEGDTADKSSLYMLMERVENILAANIVRGLPEYDKANWS